MKRTIYDKFAIYYIISTISNTLYSPKYSSYLVDPLVE